VRRHPVAVIPRPLRIAAVLCWQLLLVAAALFVLGATRRAAAVVDTVLGIAEEIGSTPTQVSLAWLRHRAELARTALIPIVGPRSPAHLQEYLRSLDLELSEQHYQRVDEISAVRLGTPHEDVAAALSGGFDGDRATLLTPPIPVL
jgi:diketogulonate reductase-like aldo/keto reductase